MKRPIPPAFVALLVFTIPAISATPASTVMPMAVDQPAVAAVTAGDYLGEWRNGSDSGELRFKLKQAGSVWSAEASFTFQSQPIAAKVSSLAVQGGKIEMVLSWNIQDTPGQSRLTGERTGDKLEGSFQSETPSETSGGTWTVTRT